MRKPSSNVVEKVTGGPNGTGKSGDRQNGTVKWRSSDRREKNMDGVDIVNGGSRQDEQDSCMPPSPPVPTTKPA